jgi:excisionase family DNA binding protein
MDGAGGHSMSIDAIEHVVHPDPEPEPRIGRSVSLDHAAEILGVSRRTIYNRIRDGRLTTIRTLGGSQRVLLDSVMEMRPRGETKPLTLVPGRQSF